MWFKALDQTSQLTALGIPSTTFFLSLLREEACLISSRKLPHNVLLVAIVDGYIPKVANFGLAKRHNVRDGSGVRGTQLFFSPEAMVFGIQEAPSDIWALGCTVLMMLTGKPPWACTSKFELLSQIATETLTIPHHISKATQNFLSCCFVRHSAKRLTAIELLSHFFLLESDECKEVFIQESAEVSNQKYLGVKP
ncbi:hypothetical protein SO802_024634 [Lithocarpus litseifolius]|uniref:Protein kinase domain-containing protein n=1 Tax=Lithocarpus litseifolius TaxID=425828 RepID=A0AAW2CAW2_9ROSI